MICDPCKRAGARIPEWLSAPTGEGQRGELRRKIKTLHKRCQHPSTCACQHKVEDAIQKEYRRDRSA